jgi:hypothetical protein
MQFLNEDLLEDSIWNSAKRKLLNTLFYKLYELEFFDEVFTLFVSETKMDRKQGIVKN